MKNFRVIMKVCLALLVFAVAVPALMDLFNANTIEAISFATLAALPVAGKIETAVDIKERRSEIHTYLDSMNKKAKDEKRDLTADELKEYDDLNKEFRDLGERLKRVEADEQRQAEMAGNKAKLSNKEKEARDLAKYSFSRAILASAEGRSLDGLEGEMHQEAIKEARESGINLTGFGVPNIILGVKAIEERAMTATGQTSAAGDQGGMLIETAKEGLIMALRPKLVLASLGTKTFGNMVGNIGKVKGSSTSVAWEGENDDNADTSVATSMVTISPKRLGASSIISKSLLMQTSKSVDQDVLNDILKAIAQEVERCGIKGGGSGEPVGILATNGIGNVVGGANGAAPTLDHLINLETEVAIDNADIGSLHYLTNAKVRGKLKKTVIDTGSGIMTWPLSGNEVNGYLAGITNLVPWNLVKGESGAVCSAIIFGDFSNLEIYNWAGIDIVVDPYSLKKKNQIELSVNSFWDVFVKYPEAFAAMLDATTA